MNDQLKVKKVSDGKVCNLHVIGVLDYGTMDPFVSVIRSLESGIQHVIIDFSRLEFIDSTGIGAIINLAHEARIKNFKVTLQGITKEINELFEMIGIFEILKTLLQEEG